MVNAPGEMSNVAAGAGVVQDPDLEWLLLDSTVIRARPHPAGMNGGPNHQTY